MIRRSILVLTLQVILQMNLLSQVKLVTENPAGVSERLQQEIDRTRDPRLGYVPKGRMVNAYNERIEILVKNTNRSLLNWVERGPNSDVFGPYNGNPRPGNGKSAGRVRAVWEDLGDPTGKTVWAGGIDGGLWKTNDITSEPAAWTPINDFFGNLSISSICQDPTDANILYFGTGEKAVNADAVRGAGIWMSIDHGANWSFMEGTENFWNVSKIVCDAFGNLYVGCSSLSNNAGLQRYTKSTETWTDITPQYWDRIIPDIELSSTGRLHVICGYYASSYSCYRFTDNPETVTPSTWSSGNTPPFSTKYNVDLASNGNTLYALPSNSSWNVPVIYKSTDGGVNWTSTANTPPFTSGLSWYTMAVAIDPNNANNVIVGALDCYKTTNGGGTWTKISNWTGTTGQYVHADQQIISWNANNQVLIGSDGGVHYSADGGTTINDRNEGLRIKQFYSVALHPSSTNYFLAGAQDNGVHQFSSAGLGSTVEVTGGDGAFVHIDKDQPQYQWGSNVYNQYRRSTDGGISWTSVNLSTNAGRFINPTDYDDVNNIMYCASYSNEFIRWTNPQTGNTYTSIPMTALNNGQVSAIKVSPYNSTTVFFGGSSYGSPSIIKAVNANATPVFTSIIGSEMVLDGSYVSSVEVGTNEQNMIVTFSNYGINNIWVTNDGGINWSAVDGNLPDIPVRWAMFYPGSDTKAIIATETGVWQTDLLDGAATLWFPETEFPNVRTDMLQYRSADGTLAAATHGRGLFTAMLQAIPTCASVTDMTASAITTNSAMISWTEVPGANNYDVEYKLNSSSTWVNAATATTNTSVALSGLTDGSLYDYRVRANCTDLSGSYRTAQFTTTPIIVCPGIYDISTNGKFTGAATVPFNTDIYGLINISSDIDHYKFIITTGGTATITLTGLPANYDLNILKSDGKVLVSSKKTGTTSESISRTFTAGTYYAKVNGVSKSFNATNCYDLKIQLGTATGNQRISAVDLRTNEPTDLQVKLFPNPVQDMLSVYIVGDNTQKNLDLYDMSGRLIFKQQINNMITTLDVHALAKGIYIAKIRNAGGKVLRVEKFVKK